MSLIRKETKSDSGADTVHTFGTTENATKTYWSDITCCSSVYQCVLWTGQSSAESLDGR